MICRESVVYLLYNYVLGHTTPFYVTRLINVLFQTFCYAPPRPCCHLPPGQEHGILWGGAAHHAGVQGEEVQAPDQARGCDSGCVFQVSLSTGDPGPATR